MYNNMFCGFFTRRLTKQAEGQRKNPQNFKKTRPYKNTILLIRPTPPALKFRNRAYCDPVFNLF
jgi:hypothetical protein